MDIVHTYLGVSSARCLTSLDNLSAVTRDYIPAVRTSGQAPFAVRCSAAPTHLPQAGRIGDGTTGALLHAPKLDGLQPPCLAAKT